METSLDKQLKKFLKKNVVSKELQDKVRARGRGRRMRRASAHAAAHRLGFAQMAVADPKLAGLIKKKLSINVRPPPAIAPGAAPTRSRPLTRFICGPVCV